jgi:hypothetical protein
MKLVKVKESQFLPELNDVVKEMLLRVWSGQASAKDRTNMIRYGMLCQDGNWSCEFVYRHYFSLLFHTHSAVSREFSDGRLPDAVTILKIGFKELEWRQIKQSAQSSFSGGPD